MRRDLVRPDVDDQRIAGKTCRRGCHQRGKLLLEIGQTPLEVGGDQVGGVLELFLDTLAC